MEYIRVYLNDDGVVKEIIKAIGWASSEKALGIQHLPETLKFACISEMREMDEKVISAIDDADEKAAGFAEVYVSTDLLEFAISGYCREFGKDKRKVVDAVRIYDQQEWVPLYD